MKERYDWVTYSVPVNVTVTPELKHHFAVEAARGADTMARLAGLPARDLAAHVRGCTPCQERWAEQIMRAHVEAVLMRVIER